MFESADMFKIQNVPFEVMQYYHASPLQDEMDMFCESARPQSHSRWHVIIINQPPIIWIWHLSKKH